VKRHLSEGSGRFGDVGVLQNETGGPSPHSSYSSDPEHAAKHVADLETDSIFPLVAGGKTLFGTRRTTERANALPNARELEGGPGGV
jgi:hypothetical protein